MPRIAVGVAVLLALTLSPRALFAGEVHTVRIRAFCTRSENGHAVPADRWGTAIVVKDWNRAPGLYLVTALHVVDHCSGVEVQRVQCDRSPPATPAGMIPAGAAISVWPSHDVAAIPITAAQKQSFIGGAAPASFGDGESAPALGQQLAVEGTSEHNPCADSIGFATAVATADGVIGPIAARAHRDVGALRGSLAPSLPLLLYFSPVGAGASGGAVARLHTNVIIGVHQGGVRGFPLGWAVFLGQNPGAALGQPLNGTLDHWPEFTFAVPALQEAQAQDLPDTLVDPAETLHRRYVRQSAIFSLSLPYERVVAGRAAPGWQLVPQLGWVGELVSWPAATKENSFGVRGSVGVPFGHFQERLLAPDGTQFELHDVARFGLASEVALHLRLRRLAPVRPSFDLGARAAVLVWSASFASDIFLAPAFVARGRVSLSRASYHAVTLELAVLVSREPGSDFRYTGAGADIVGPGFAWLTSIAAGLGYEY
jgi:hypothetical protein